jgi:hypothetical protein
VKPITKPNYWELRKGDVLLGTLVAYDLDFPWFYCHFTPTEAFAPHRAGFDEDLRWLEVGEADEAYYDHYEKITADMKLIPRTAIATVSSSSYCTSTVRKHGFVPFTRNDTKWLDFLVCYVADVAVAVPRNDVGFAIRIIGV